MPGEVTLEGEGVEKAVEIELQTETQISKAQKETFHLEHIALELIDEQRKNVAQLQALFTFEKE